MTTPRARVACEWPAWSVNRRGRGRDGRGSAEPGGAGVVLRNPAGRGWFGGAGGWGWFGGTGRGGGGAAGRAGGGGFGGAGGGGGGSAEAGGRKGVVRRNRMEGWFGGTGRDGGG